MKDFNDRKFDKILEQINNEGLVIIDTKLELPEFTTLSYFLVNKFYYPAIIDDYSFEITDKESLLEALYYQVKLITIHDLNWDAIEEGLNDALNNFSEFKGILLLFRGGQDFRKKLSDEFKILAEILKEINSQSKTRKIKIVI